MCLSICLTICNYLEVCLYGRCNQEQCLQISLLIQVDIILKNNAESSDEQPNLSLHNYYPSKQLMKLY